MKKLFSVLLSVLLVGMTAVPALGADGDTPPNAVHEGDFWYVIEQTEDGPAFTYLRYAQDWDRIWSEQETSVHIPKSLGGITLTPENFTGSVFYPWDGGCTLPFSLDADNASFTLIDGILYSKDGKTLICYPLGCPDYSEKIWHIPDGTTGFADGAVCDEFIECDCLVLPDSFTGLCAETFPIDCASIAACSGTAAERFAREQEIRFIPIDAGHTHVYFRQTCWHTPDVSHDTIRLICPCGDVLRTETLENGCIEYGGSQRECPCICHKAADNPYVFSASDTPREILQMIIFYIRRMVWHLTGTHQICECGALHW